MDFKEVDLKDYLKILYKNKNIFLIVLASIFIFTLIFTLLSPKVFEAKTTVVFSGSSSIEQLVSFGGISLPVPGSAGKEGSSISTTSPSVLSPLMNKIASANYTKVLLQSRRIRLGLAKKLDLYKVYHTKSDDNVCEIIRLNTTVYNDRDGLMTITTRSNTPELAAQMANGYVELVKEYNDSSKVGMARRRRIFVEKQLEKKNMELKDLSQKIEDFTSQHRIFDLAIYTSNIQSENEFIESSIRKNNMDYIQYKQSLTDMKKELIFQLKASEKDFTQFNAVKDAHIIRIREELINKKVNLMLAQRGKSNSHPAVVKINLEILTLENLYRDQVQKYIKNLNTNFSKEFVDMQTKLFLAEATKEALAKNKKEFEERLKKLPKVILNYMNLKREFDVLRANCAMLAQDLESSRVAEVQEMPELEVLDAATPPENKSYPKTKANLLTGLLFGLVFGLIASVAWEYVDKNVIDDIIRKSRTLYPVKKSRNF